MQPNSLNHLFDCYVYYLKDTKKCDEQCVIIADAENVPLPSSVSSKDNGPPVRLNTQRTKNRFGECRGFSWVRVGFRQSISYSFDYRYIHRKKNRLYDTQTACVKVMLSTTELPRTW